jgi:cysteinyl-tRNA synthetase
MVHAGNRDLDAGNLDWSAEAVINLLARFDTVLGVLERPPMELPDEIEAMATARVEARKARDWAESDRLRDALKAAGWEVRDTPDGQRLTAVL